MKSLEILGNKNSITENLLNMDNINEVNIHFAKGFLTGAFIFTGNIKFVKNNTELYQNFKGDSIGDIYLQIFNFCKTL